MIVLVAVAAAQEAPKDEAQANADALRSHVDQARLFIKKKWYEDAKTELEAAVALPDGRIDPEAWYLLATVRYELCDIEAARQAAQRAHSYSRTDDQLQLAAGFSAFLEEQFGIVDIRAPYEGLSGRLDIQLESTLFDATLKLYLERLAEQHDGRIVFPIRVGLPAATYRINGQQVVVEPASRTDVELGAGAVAVGGAAQLARVEIALGTGGWMGADVRHWLPTFSTQIAVVQPLDPVVLGLVFDWSPALWQTVNERTLGSPVAWSLGGRVGVPLGEGQVAVRPSLGYRYGYMPGIELDCVDTGDAFRCAEGAQPDLVIYAIGRAHVPFVEVSADWLPRQWKSRFGFGVKGVGEHAFGTLPRQAEATIADRSVTYDVAPGTRGWHATGVRFLLNVSMAF